MFVSFFVSGLFENLLELFIIFESNNNNKLIGFKHVSFNKHDTKKLNKS